MNRMPSAALLRARKTVKKGLKFTVMLCGPGGCGKSTFINTVCGREVVSPQTRPIPGPSEAHLEPGQMVEIVTEDIADDTHGVVTIRFIDTPGFGDNIDNTVCFTQLSNYIDQQFDEVLAEESRIRRNPKFTDNRVHALVYFVEATGHGLRELDVAFMRLMAPRVNIIPVIAKADTLTQKELALNKRLVMEDIEHYSIPVYNFPVDSDGEDEDLVNHNTSLRAIMPFAVVGGTDVITVKGRSRLVRQYPWGYVDVDDPKVSDTGVLTDILLRSHLLELKDTTHDYLYETYRTEKLSAGTAGGLVAGSSPASPSSLGGPEPVDLLSREEKIRMDEEKLRAVEQRVQEEIARKKEELLQRERELKELELRLQRQSVEPKVEPVN